MAQKPKEPSELTKRSDAFTDLALTLPIFVAYHLGVVFLPIRNAADPVTRELRSLANHSIPLYAGLTLALGVAFVAVLLSLGRREAFSRKRFFFIALEGALYASIMRAASIYVVGVLPLAPKSIGLFGGFVMSLGAGFYEEIAFRVGLFGVGAFLLRMLVKSKTKQLLGTLAWAVGSAVIFSAWHYVGPLGDAWDLKSFVFRAVCGLVLVAVYGLRGFAPAVWTHTIYDLWVLVLAN